jgi:hypothetical protein
MARTGIIRQIAPGGPVLNQWHDAGADIVQQIAEVLHRGGQCAIPAADPEPGSTHQDAVAAQRLTDRHGHRDHPQHSRLNRAGGGGAHLLAAVGNHDHAPD